MASNCITDVVEVFTQYRQGERKHYDYMVNQLNDPLLTNEGLLPYLKGLRRCITELGKDKEILVSVVLKIDWLSRDMTVVKEYQTFIVNLVSAHTFYLGACLRMIVKQFIPKTSALPVKSDGPAVVADVTRWQDNEAFGHLHTLLKTVVGIVPMTPLVLIPMLADHYPFLAKDSYCQECYATNLLKLTYYLPSHRSAILQLIVDRITKLDVRAPREDIQKLEVDSDSDSEHEDIFDVDDLAVKTTPMATPPMAHKEANKLDCVMHLLFTYIHSVCYTPDNTLNWEETKKLYRELLDAFDRLLLPTHASCHVQFVMFYICSFKAPLADGFIDYLWKKVENPNVQGVFRQAAVAYIASFLARTMYIPMSTVRIHLETMVRWIHRYTQEAAFTTSKPDVLHHGPFYSVCQAVFYVFVFRHKELLDMRDGLKFCQGLGLQTIVTCRLNPLKMCLPVVANTFASITRIHQVAMCDTILEKNRRCKLPEAGDSTGHSQSSRLTHLNPLDSFFPFDPYLLTRSGQFIHHMYQEYDGTPVQPVEDTVVQEEDLYMDADVDDLGVDGCSPTLNSAKMLATSPTDFLLYGTSPGFHRA